MQDNPDGIGEADLRAAISDFLSNGEHKLQRISRTCIRKMLHKDNKCSILESEKGAYIYHPFYETKEEENNGVVYICIIICYSDGYSLFSLLGGKCIT